MLCLTCEFQNPPSHRYCGRCGSKLPTTAPLRTLSGALQGERKQVTVMFADISGFTAMSEQRDAEEVVTLVNACFAQLSECVYRYEGTIDKYIGDEIMAVFGAPRAHEDDPERTIRTALDMREALDKFNANPPLPLAEPLAIHIGIGTGYVVHGLIGTERHQDRTVMGDAVNLAARLEDVSERGQIFVSEDTYRLTSRLFVFKELDPVTVKGKAAPVKIYEVLGVREQPGSMRGLTGLRAPLVGRDTEAQLLSVAVSGLQAGHGGVVLVEGEAGIGKSRLVAEVRHNLESVVPGLRWLEGRGLSYGRSLSYHLLASVLRNYLGLTDEDDEMRAWLKLRAMGPDLFGERADDVLPYLAMLLGLRLPEVMAEKIPQADPQLLQQRVFVAFGEWVKAVCADKPLILAFDDMHWADPSSVELIEHLMELTKDHQLLILCVSRPDREAPFWEIRERSMTEYGDTLVHIPLKPLSSSQSRTLLDSLLQIERLPREIEHAILIRAEGNPLFVEEVLRTLIEEGTLTREDGSWRVTRAVDITEIPDTLQGVLTARIDRLDDTMKRVVQIAAVVGRVFQRYVLDRTVDDPSILDNCLAQLQIAEIIRERSTEPDAEYIFKHILTQEAAYRSLLSQQRKAYHRRIADALARLFWERGEEYAGLVAAHYERAEAWPRALRYLKRAGDAARTSFAIKEAIDYYNRALQVADRLGDAAKPADRLSLYEHRGQLLARLADVEGALGDYERMHDLAQAVSGSKKAELRALNEIGALQAGRHDYVRAADHFNQALALARDIGDEAGIADSFNRLGGFYFNAGKPDDAQACHRESLEIARALQDNALLAASLDGLGQIDLLRGRVRAGLDKYGQIADLQRRLGDQAGLMEALNALAAAYIWLGEYGQAAEACEEALAFVSKVGNLPVVPSLHTYLAISHLNRGDLGKAGDHLQAGILVARSLEHISMQVFCLSWLAYYHLVLGWFDTALGSVEEAVNLAHKLGSLWDMRARTGLGIVRLYRGQLNEAVQVLSKVYEVACELDFAPEQAVVLYELGRAYLATGNLEAAGQSLKGLLGVADRCELREYQIRGRWLQGRFALAKSDLDEALEALEDAHARAEAIGSRLILWRTDSALGDVHRAAGRSAEAKAAYQRAWETLHTIAATLPDEEAQRSMLAAPLAAKLQERMATGE